ncbi:hypothetical protein BJX76DRAFT_360818 [Aspergillus varians]
MCKRDRDFTNLLDLKYEHHTTFLKRLKHHVEFFHTWRELRDSAAARNLCIEQFLDIYGTEYWGVQHRAKYIMSDSVARGDDVRYPEDSPEIKKTLLLLVKKKADGMSKGSQVEEPVSSQTVVAPSRVNTRASTRANTPATRAASIFRFAPLAQNEQNKQEEREQNRAEEDDEEAVEEELPRYTTLCRTKRRTMSEARTRITPPSDTSSLSSVASLSSPGNSAIPATSNMSAPSLIDASFAKALRSKYCRDTFFLVTMDQKAVLNVAPAWVKFQNFKSASLFLLDMGRGRGLEKEWWTPNAQMEVEGGSGPNQADHVSAAQEIISMASVRFEWSDDEVLVRWGNDSDWGVVIRMIQKAWVAKEFGDRLIDLFKIRVVLHLEDY